VIVPKDIMTHVEIMNSFMLQIPVNQDMDLLQFHQQIDARNLLVLHVIINVQLVTITMNV